jgi:hypothetical protein
MPLIVRSTLRNPVVFAKRDIAITWAVAGDPVGADTQMVPDSLAEDIDFLETVRRGTLVIEHFTNDEVRAKFEGIAAFAGRRASQVQAANEQANAAIEATIDRRQQRDIVGRPCLGPDGRGNPGQCGTQVLTQAAQTGAEPPLCSQHQHLVNQFYLAEDGSPGEGATESRAGQVSRVWKPITMTAPTRG